MPTVATTGTITPRTVLRPRTSAMTEPITTSTAAATAILRNNSISASRLGSMTTISAPISAPERVFRPPMIIASRNMMVNSKL